MTTTMTIRNIDNQLKAPLRIKAAMHGRSMEEEARDIPRAALSVQSVCATTLVEAIRARVAPLNGIGLTLPERGSMRESPEFGV
jgi:plasmid stability protein